MLLQSPDSRFPEPIREIWALLSGDVLWLHHRWIIYRQLFGTNKARVDLFNEVAGTVACILQQVLLHDVQLSLSKLGDPPGKGTRENLTLLRLRDALATLGADELVATIGPMIEEFDASCRKLRLRRNKWIAHSDLATKRGSLAEPLLGPSRQEIEEALLVLRRVMNSVQKHYTHGETLYEHMFMDGDDGMTLISALARALRYRELVKDGTIPRGDFLSRFPSGV